MQYSKVEICGVNTSSLKVLSEKQKQELLNIIKNGSDAEKKRADDLAASLDDLEKRSGPKTPPKPAAEWRLGECGFSGRNSKGELTYANDLREVRDVQTDKIKAFYFSVINMSGKLQRVAFRLEDRNGRFSRAFDAQTIRAGRAARLDVPIGDPSQVNGVFRIYAMPDGGGESLVGEAEYHGSI